MGLAARFMEFVLYDAHSGERPCGNQTSSAANHWASNRNGWTRTDDEPGARNGAGFDYKSRLGRVRRAAWFNRSPEPHLEESGSHVASCYGFDCSPNFDGTCAVYWIRGEGSDQSSRGRKPRSTERRVAPSNLDVIASALGNFGIELCRIVDYVWRSTR